jgi:hypothetical protein
LNSLLFNSKPKEARIVSVQAPSPLALITASADLAKPPVPVTSAYLEFDKLADAIREGLK